MRKLLADEEKVPALQPDAPDEVDVLAQAEPEPEPEPEAPAEPEPMPAPPKKKRTRSSHTTEEEFIDDLRRTAKKINGHLTKKKYEDEHEPDMASLRTITRRFGNWGNALEAAGLELTEGVKRSRSMIAKSQPKTPSKKSAPEKPAPEASMPESELAAYKFVSLLGYDCAIGGLRIKKSSASVAIRLQETISFDDAESAIVKATETQILLKHSSGQLTALPEPEPGCCYLVDQELYHQIPSDALREDLMPVYRVEHPEATPAGLYVSAPSKQ